jgi:hypothetical protein
MPASFLGSLNEKGKATRRILKDHSSDERKGSNMRKQPGYTIFLILTILSTLAAVSTVLPDPSASAVSFLGYRTHCIWAPWSTAICVVLSGVFCTIRAKKFKVSGDVDK